MYPKISTCLSITVLLPGSIGKLLRGEPREFQHIIRTLVGRFLIFSQHGIIGHLGAHLEHDFFAEHRSETFLKISFVNRKRKDYEQ